eukprot:Sspe_Gene.24146::Locus_9498_Transcript_2_3_Confidence_0.333_Length_1231::g.24146::m.24146
MSVADIPYLANSRFVSPISSRPSTPDESENLVKLNVGGTRFMTLKSTLLPRNDTPSYFRVLLSNTVPVGVDEEGAIFVDRDPVLFSSILHYLRTHEWVCPPGRRPDEVLNEARYYGVTISPCDFTVPWIRSHRKEVEDPFIVRVGEFIVTHFHRALDIDAPLVFAAIPCFETVKSHLTDTKLRTGPDTTERIDLDKLKIAPRTAEDVQYVMDDQVCDALHDIPLDALIQHMSSHRKFTVTIEKGCVYFPYSSTLRDDEEDEDTAPNVPIYSKLHGMLHISRSLPSNREGPLTAPDTPVSDRYAHLHARYLPVATAWYIAWSGEQWTGEPTVHPPPLSSE